MPQASWPKPAKRECLASLKTTRMNSQVPSPSELVPTDEFAEDAEALAVLQEQERSVEGHASANIFAPANIVAPTRAEALAFEMFLEQSLAAGSLEGAGASTPLVADPPPAATNPSLCATAQETRSNPWELHMAHSNGPKFNF